MIKINSQAPEITSKAFHDGKNKEIKLSDYRGKWVILFFYPADFTFICPTELGDIADRYDEIKSLNTEVLSVSTDTVFVHKAWHDKSDTIKKIVFPMLADPTAKICKDYETYIDSDEDAGLSNRATFIINPEGKIAHAWPKVTAEGHAKEVRKKLTELKKN